MSMPAIKSSSSAPAVASASALPAASERGRDDGADPEPPQWLAIDIVADDSAWKAVPDAEALVTAAVHALCRDATFRDEPPALACIALTTDAAVQALNREHRKKDKPTNVLSFPAPDGATGDDGQTAFLGDVAIAAETVLAEAHALSVPAAHHLQHLAVHGVLHLLGFDHETSETDATEMEALETRILATLGIADPYSETH